ncbi:fatty acid coa synthetase family [Anaeramoeba flamelloides]|uniref:Fatty acid coa synthetase family n=1 Tax=Anaeramoeba flamelloides TaxID=1746091 RepID=A0ABQ8YX98_9EUKA|nr:fatty acid coa synthetase family [Anaeramoeba flamelloides]
MSHISIIDSEDPNSSTQNFTVNNQKVGISIIDLDTVPLAFYCNDCRSEIIEGKTRWVCTECDDFDLCNECYLKGNHDHLMYIDLSEPDSHQREIKKESYLSRIYERIFLTYKFRPCLGIFNNDDEIKWYQYCEIFHFALQLCFKLKKIFKKKKPKFVIIAAEIRLEWLIADLACAFLGITTVPILPNEKYVKIKNIQRQIGDDYLIICSKKTRKIYQKLVNENKTKESDNKIEKEVQKEKKKEKEENEKEKKQEKEIEIEREEEKEKETEKETKKEIKKKEEKDKEIENEIEKKEEKEKEIEIEKKIEKEEEKEKEENEKKIEIEKKEEKEKYENKKRKSKQRNIMLMEEFNLKYFEMDNREDREKNQNQILEEIEEWSNDLLVESSPETVYTIMFTSGSTGDPKGAVFHHSTWIQRVLKKLGVTHKLPRPYCIYTFTHFGYSATRESFPITMFYGGRVALSRGVERILKEVKIANPTFFNSTPRLYEIIYSQYKEEQKENTLSEQELRRKYRKVFGNRVKMVSTGGAKTSKKIWKFLNYIFRDIRVKDAFGATECGSICTNFKKVVTADIKLVDCPEMNYFVSEGYGEICVKSKEMIKGYYKNKSATQENFTEDGYFKTGDIGKIIDDKIKVIDRKKFTIKLSQGVFLNLNYLEEIFKNSEKISQIFISVDKENTFLVAIVVPEQNFKNLTKEDFLDEMNTLANEKGLYPYEIPRDIYLELDDPFSKTNGLLTFSGKKKRFEILKKYQKKLDTMTTNLNNRKKKISKNNNNTLNISNKNNKNKNKNKNENENENENKEKSIKKLLLETLNLEKINLDKSISQNGGDSLAIIRIKDRVKKHFGINLPKFIFYLSTNDFIEFIINPSTRNNIYRKYENSLDWEKESALANNYKTKIEKKKKLDLKKIKFKTIFLTGATGFLGIHIMAELLTRKDINCIYCLVRGSDLKSTKTRLNKLFKQNRLKFKNSKKVQIILGDLTKNYFGLEKVLFMNLAKECDLIIHSGCHVDSMLPYSVLKTPNVYGTKQIIKMATLFLKPVIHISTLSVFFNTRKIEKTTDPFEKNPPKNGSGYNQTKWVAEKLIHQARTKYHLDIAVFRPASIFANYKTGYLPPKDLVFKMLSGLIKLNSFLLDSDSYFDLTPVDVCSKLIVDFTFNKFDQIIKLPAIPLTNPTKYSLYYLLDCFEKSQKAKLEKANYKKFRKLLIKDADNPLTPMLGRFLRFPFPKLVHIDCEILLKLLCDEKIPRIDIKFLKKVFSLMKKNMKK